MHCNLFRYWSEHAQFAITTHRNVSPKMAASGLERDDGGLKIEPNFELLAILLALALQEEDAERFLEVYDNIVPKSLSTCEVRKHEEFRHLNHHTIPHTTTTENSRRINWIMFQFMTCLSELM